MLAKLKNTKNMIITTIATASIAVVMALFIFGMVSYVQQAIHDERCIYLTSQTDSTAALVNKSVGQYLDYAGVCARMVETELNPYTDLSDFIDEIADKLYLENARIILVDSNCTWYGEDGTTGHITDVASYASDTEKELAYMTTGVDASVESIVYRVRMEEPIKAKTQTGVVDIAFCSVVCYLDTLDEQLAEVFPYSSNSFIIDDTGLMLYRSFGLGLLMQGSNIFNKYERVDFKYGDDGSELLERIHNHETTAGEFYLNGEDFFICTAKLDLNDWYLTFVVPTDNLTSGSYITTMTLYISSIAMLFAAVIITLFLILLRNERNTKNLEFERHANALLSQASAAKSDFLSNMSHDIRTPINGIMGMTLLAQKENNPPKTEDCLNRIDGASRYLLSLVNDVLDMSSIESGKIVITRRQHNIIELAEDCVSIIDNQMTGRQLELITELEKPENPYVMADELHLRQILINILSNAVKYTHDGGRITFRMKIMSQLDNILRLRFEVEDTGIGMKPEFLEHIWDSFSQEEGGSRTQYKGTGLGMTIAKKLTELMDGEITVQSVYNEGSTFAVELPFELTEMPEAAESTELAGGSSDIRGVKILLAEDNELNMMIARELLEDEGAIVTPATNGREALETFCAFGSGSDDGFDLILMDVMMPEMDGLEATRAIRALDRPDAAAIPIIAMTAKAFSSDIEETQAAGMNAHLSKPIDVQTMIKTISSYYHKGGTNQ